MACIQEEGRCNTGDPALWSVRTNRTPARDRPGRVGSRRGPEVPRKPGNAGGGKGPWFKINATRGEGAGNWET